MPSEQPQAKGDISTLLWHSHNEVLFAGFFAGILPPLGLFQPKRGGNTMRVFALALLAVTATIPSPLLAQAVYGMISGNVTDSSGLSVPGAKITITDIGKGVTYPTTTNESGNYSHGHLIVGVYEVRVESVGFTPYVQKNVHVEVDAVTSINVRLTVGSVGETVSITAEAPILKSEKSDVSDTMTQRQIQEMPV